MIKSFLHLIALALVAMGFVACSEESRLGIKKPLVFPTMDDYGKIYYAIQSQDENTIIEDYVVNRGNCGRGLTRYRYDLDLQRQHQKELCAKYKDKEICKDGELVAILDKQGKERYVKYFYNDGLSKISLSTYNTFNDDFKKLYEEPAPPEKLGYGKTMKIDIGRCNSSDIMEVQLTLNGGKKVTYNLKGGY